MTDLIEYSAGCLGAARGPDHGAQAVVTAGLVRRYGSTVAVDGIDLEVGRGEIYGFLGPNGAGKSTLIRMLCTLLRPSAGVAVVAGYDVVAEPQEVRLRIGVALQDAALDDRQTGRELLALQGRLYGLRRAEIRARLDEVLDLVDIGSAIDRRIGTYSGGMKRRLDLAAALVHNPEVLFLDEPTTGLDPDSRAAVWAEVRRLNSELGHHDLPHHAVPGGGRRAGRPGRDHGARSARGRGHPRRAEAVDRGRCDRRRHRSRPDRQSSTTGPAPHGRRGHDLGGAGDREHPRRVDGHAARWPWS